MQPLGTAPLFVWRVLGRDVFGFADGTRRGIGVSGVATYEIRPGATEVVACPAGGIDETELEEWFDRVVVPFAVQLQEGLQVLHAGGVSMSGIGIVGLCAGDNRRQEHDGGGACRAEGTRRARTTCSRSRCSRACRSCCPCRSS